MVVVGLLVFLAGYGVAAWKGFEIRIRVGSARLGFQQYALRRFFVPGAGK